MSIEIQPIVDKCFPLVEQYMQTPYVEMELRIGRYNGNFFDTDVGRERWERVLSGLRQYDGWESAYVTHSDSYYNDANSIRITVDASTGAQTMVPKVRAAQEDFTEQGAPVDVRFCVSTEVPATGQYEMDRKLVRVRHSFVRKNLRIDMTQVTGIKDMDSEEPTSFQIELEIVDPTKIQYVEEFYNMCHKINNLLMLM